MQNYKIWYYMDNGEKFERRIEADSINEALLNVSSGEEFFYGDQERKVVLKTKYIQAIEISKL